MDKRVEKGRATRERLVQEATRLFAADGYEAVSIEQVRIAARISRGALFHHFASKDALFLAVLEATEEQVAAHMALAAGKVADPIAALKAGAAGWLRLAASDAAVRRIVLTDAPGVLGWQRWRELDARYGLGLLRLGLAAAGVPDARLDLASRCLLAVLIELALMVAAAPDDAITTAEATAFAEDAVDRLFAAPAA